MPASQAAGRETLPWAFPSTRARQFFPQQMAALPTTSPATTITSVARDLLLGGFPIHQNLSARDACWSADSDWKWRTNAGARRSASR